MDRSLLSGLAAISAGFLGALCCAGPLIFVTLGVGAGLAGTFEPLRPLFGAVMVVALAAGFYSVYGRPSVGATCDADGACEVPRNRRREKVVLWLATALALIFWSFTYWSTLLV